jgi:hypothetical protein
LPFQSCFWIWSETFKVSWAPKDKDCRLLPTVSRLSSKRVVSDDLGMYTSSRFKPFSR